MHKYKIKISGIEIEVEISVNNMGNLVIVTPDLEKHFPEGITSEFYGEELVLSKFQS